jgi:AcrR family transcriptional regulator
LPAINVERRIALTDAAIAVLGKGGAHGLTHRAVDDEAGLPKGTTSNYFPSRDALLEATLARVIETHRAWMDELQTTGPDSVGRAEMIDLMVQVISEAATRYRSRYVAVFELALESMRRPALAEAFDALWGDARTMVKDMHRSALHDPSDVEVHLLNTVYNGVLFLRLVTPKVLDTERWDQVIRTALEAVLPAEER